MLASDNFLHVLRTYLHKAADAVQAYLEDGGIAQDREGILFRSTGGRGRGLSERPLATVDVFRMIKRRAKAAGFGTELGCHTFRATGLTNYLINGGTLETGAEIAGHASTKTTQLYDRRRDKVTQAEIERIRMSLRPGQAHHVQHRYARCHAVPERAPQCRLYFTVCAPFVCADGSGDRRGVTEPIKRVSIATYLRCSPRCSQQPLVQRFVKRFVLN